MLKVQFCDYLEKQYIINSQYYSDMLMKNVKPAMRQKQRGSQRKGVILLHNNECPHIAQLTQEIICKMGWDYIIPPTAQIWHHLIFTSLVHYNEDIKNFVEKWLKQQGKDFFAAGIKKLVNHWTSASMLVKIMLKSRKSFIL